MKNVMIRAWEIAKDGVAKFGGKVKEYFAEALKMAWAEMNAPKTAEIRFPYCKKHWCAKIIGSDIVYKLERDFLVAEEDGNDIVYANLTAGIYQLSRFGKTGNYLKIENGVTSDITESEVMEMFKAPKKGLSQKEAQAIEEDGYGDRYEFSLDVETFEESEVL